MHKPRARGLHTPQRSAECRRPLRTRGAFCTCRSSNLHYSDAHMSDDQPPTNVSRIWGGRFATGPSAVMQAINVSIDFDARLIEQDVAASKAHATMLARQGIIAQADGHAIVAGLDQILQEAREGRLTLSRALEDVHMNIENRLAELIGEAADVCTPRARETTR